MGSMSFTSLPYSYLFQFFAFVPVLFFFLGIASLGWVVYQPLTEVQVFFNLYRTKKQISLSIFACVRSFFFSLPYAELLSILGTYQVCGIMRGMLCSTDNLVNLLIIACLFLFMKLDLQFLVHALTFPDLPSTSILLTPIKTIIIKTIAKSINLEFINLEFISSSTTTLKKLVPRTEFSYNQM